MKKPVRANIHKVINVRRSTNISPQK